MKNLALLRRVLRFILPCFLGGVCALVAGCATTGYQKGDATARSLQHASYEVQAERRALEQTMQSLNELVNRPGADLKPQYKRFSSMLDRLIAEAKRNDEADREIMSRSTDYFEAWEKDLAAMQFEVIRAKSQARKVEAMNNFQAVHQRYLEAQTVMQPLLGYLEDIRKALRSDLTQSGLEALKPIAGHAEENSAKVQVALNKLSAELNTAGTRLSSIAFQNAKAAPANTTTRK